MKMWIATAVAMAAVGIGSAAMAQDAMKAGDAMKPDMKMMPTMVCRAATKGETASAKMPSGDGIVCKKVDVAAMMKSDPAMAKELMTLQIPLSSAQDSSLSH